MRTQTHTKISPFLTCVCVRITHFRKTFHIFYRSVRRISFIYQHTHVNTTQNRCVMRYTDTNSYFLLVSAICITVRFYPVFESVTLFSVFRIPDGVSDTAR